MTKLEKIYLEISNICNLSCPFCLVHLRPSQSMPVEQIAGILPQIKSIASSACLHVLGEPLFHPEFEDICDLFSSQDIPLEITTNGTLLYKKKTILLKKNSIRQINISVHALDSIAPIHDCRKFCDEIHQFCREARIARPGMYINLRFWNYDQILQSPAFQFFQSLFDLKNLNIDLQWKKSFRMQDRLYPNFDSQFQWPSPAQPVRSKTGYCYGLSHHCGILSNGDVVPCCLDGNGAIVLGNCFETPIEKILISPRARNMMDHFNKGVLIEPLCQRCGFISRFDKKARRIAAQNRS